MKATGVLAMVIDEASAKVRAAPPGDDPGDEHEHPRLNGEGGELRGARIERPERDQRHGARARRQPAPALHPPVESAARLEIGRRGEVAGEPAVPAGLEDERGQPDDRNDRRVFGVERGRHRADDDDGRAVGEKQPGGVQEPVRVQRGDDFGRRAHRFTAGRGTG